MKKLNNNIKKIEIKQMKINNSKIQKKKKLNYKKTKKKYQALHLMHGHPQI